MSTTVNASPDSSCNNGRELVPTAAILCAKASRGTSSQMLIPLCIYFLTISPHYQMKSTETTREFHMFYLGREEERTHQLMGLITAPPPVETTTWYIKESFFSASV